MVLVVAAEALFVPVTPIVFALHRPSWKTAPEAPNSYRSTGK
jgi:hypothetical protein